MADNYLEKKMEDMQRGKYNTRSASGGMMAGATGVSAHVRNGYLNVKFPPRRVLITGGVNGIGRAVTRVFLKAGCKVAVFDSDDEGAVMAREEGIRFYKVDLRDVAATERHMRNLLEVWKDLDIVISNAGIGDFMPLTEGSVESFDRVMEVNLRPAYVIARMWALHRKGLPLPNPFGGRMMLISSTRHMQSEKGTEAYSASKGAIASLSHALMMSLSEFGITVNTISPGWIHTGSDGELRERDHLQHPSRRVGRPEDIGRLCIFLSLPDNDFINGADIPVDGGMTRRMIYEP